MNNWYLLILILLVSLGVCYFAYQRWHKKDEFINGDSDDLVSSHVVDNLYTNTYRYRLGDVYQGRFNNPNKKWNVVYHLKKFPQSIAAEYMRKNTTQQFFNKKLITEIVNKRAENNPTARLFSTKELVLHMRLGDVNHKAFIYKKRYIKNELWWKKLMQYIKKNDITTIYIISGSHLPKYHHKVDLEESTKALFTKINFLKNHGLKVLVRLGNPPDTDVIFCHNAKHYASTGGGFGAYVIKDIVINNGGHVFSTEATGYPPREIK